MPALLLLLLACGDKDPDVADDSGTDAACTLALTLDLPDRARPGDTVPVGVSVSGADDATLAWAPSTGAVTDGLWALPDDIAVHSDEPHSLQVTASAPGCDDASATAELTVGFEPADRVVALYNPTVDGSEDVARAYATFRGLPGTALCPVSTTETVTLAGDDLAAFVATVQACIETAGPQVHYLLPVYGVPYKVSGRIDDLSGSGSKATVSLDALLVFGDAAVDFSGAIWNPLWQEGDSMAGTYDPFVPFGLLREEEDRYYLVTRIDGADAAAALDLVERAEEAQALADAGALAGTVYVDGRYGDDPPASDEFGSYESGEWNMWGTRQLFEELDLYDVVWDGNSEEFGTSPAPETCPDALFYAGWYSYNHYNDAFTWAPGAIGGHLDSCSACDLRGGSPWAANALQRGITATFGAVNEPYVAGMPEYDQLFRYLTEGATYGEAAYESTRVALWMMVFVGDPLYQPFPPG